MTKKLDKEELKDKLENDPDFIVSTKHKNSLASFLQKKPDGTDNNTIAKLLNLKSDKEVEELYKDSIEHIKTILDIEE